MEDSGSRRERNRLCRRAAIMSCAAELFFERGYANTSMSDIAAALGGSKATLWRHFPSKAALFAAIVEEQTGSFHAEVDRILERGGDPYEVLSRFGRMVANRLASRPVVRLLQLIAGETGQAPALGRVFYENGPAKVISRLAAYLEAEMEKGHLRRGDPTTLAYQLMALLQLPQQLQLWNVPDMFDDATVADYVAEAVDSFLRAHAVGAAGMMR